MSEKVFKTKTGNCHILEDRIVLTREGFRGNLSEVVVGNSISRVLIIYIAFLAYMLYQTYMLYMSGSSVRIVLHLMVAVMLLAIVIKSINNSATPVIFRDTIKEVVFNEAMGLTRAYFIVNFVNDKGRLKKRLIMLPGSLSGGEDETRKAVVIMKEEGLIKE